MAAIDDDTGNLVAEHERLLDHERADPAVLVVVHVGAADADGPDLDEDIAVAERRERAHLEADIAFRVQDRGEVRVRHCGWICTLKTSPEPANASASGNRSIGNRLDRSGCTSTVPLCSSASASWNV